MNKKLILFDYDGTIVDSAKMIVKGAIEAFRMCGLPDPDPGKVRENIGKPLATALDAYAPKGFKVNPEMISKAYRKWYAEQGRLGLQDEPLYPGIFKLLNASNAISLVLTFLCFFYTYPFVMSLQIMSESVYIFGCSVIILYLLKYNHDPNLKNLLVLILLIFIVNEIRSTLVLLYPTLFFIMSPKPLSSNHS